MGLFTPDLDTLRELYTIQLKKALNMEKQIVEALPAMVEKSTSQELANAFRLHLEESKEHVSRVERILAADTGSTGDHKCKAISAILAEGQSDISDAGNKTVRDVVLIAAGNQVEHHEMAVYGTLRNWALVLGEVKHAELLDKTLEEEKKADKTLNALSEQINTAAPVA